MPAAIPINIDASFGAAQSTGSDFSHTNGAGPVNGVHKRMNGINGIHDTNGTSGLHGLNPRSETWPGPSRSSSPTSSIRTGVTDHHEAHEYEAGGPRSRPFAHMRTWADDPKATSFPRLSKPMELMKHAYDCVVIGSGYGGGVAAANMARAGKHVCLLERGKERWPGEYPTGTGDALDQLHYSGQIVPPWLPKKVVHGGDPTGLYHLIFGNGQNALVGNGE